MTKTDEICVVRGPVLDDDEIERLRSIAKYLWGTGKNDDNVSDALFIEDVISRIVSP